jgi:hypothetical protein
MSILPRGFAWPAGLTGISLIFRYSRSDYFEGGSNGTWAQTNGVGAGIATRASCAARPEIASPEARALLVALVR